MRTFEDEWRTRFERFATQYAADHLVSGWSLSGLERRLAVFRELLAGEHFPDGAWVMDLGCGAGTYVRLLADRGLRAVGLDYSMPSLARARAADPAHAARYVAAEAYALPFEAAVFDIVISIGVLQALADPQEALDEMVRVARGGALVVVEALNRRSLAARSRRVHEAMTHIPARVRTYNPGQIRRWLKARGLRLLREAGICLPPRRWPRLALVPGASRITRVLETRSVLAELTAHTFLFVARKSSRPSGEDR